MYCGNDIVPDSNKMVVNKYTKKTIATVVLVRITLECALRKTNGTGSDMIEWWYQMLILW